MSAGCRLYLREHTTRLLGGALRMLAHGVVGLATDGSRKTVAEVVREAGPRGIAVDECPGSAAEAIADKQVVYVSGRLYAAPSGPAFDPAAGEAWAARCNTFL